MARKTGKELNKIKEKHNVDRLWSWSKVNTFKNSPYEYYLKYIKKEPPTRTSIYGVLGNVAHDIIEAYYAGEIPYEEMILEFENKLIEAELLELKYDRSDEEKNEKIAKKYEECVRHFFKNHIPIKAKIALEKFITIKIGSQLMQGYVDAVYKEDGKYMLTDWKTSTIYQGKKIDSEKGQLILYAEGLIQMGVKPEDIVPQWAFLKYLEVSYKQKNGKIKTSKAERNTWVSKIKTNLRMNLKDIDWEEDQIEEQLSYSLEFNTINNMPKEIQELYTIKDCYVEAPFNVDEIEELKQDMLDTISKIMKLESEYNSKLKDDPENAHLVWWHEVTDSDSYYFANLCEYNASQHLPYKQYLEENDMFIKDKEFSKDKNAYEDKSKNDDDNDDWMKELGLV